MKKQTIFNKKQRGFTLLEMLLVIAIIAILASIVIIAINPGRQLAQARNAQRKTDLNTLYKGSSQFLIDYHYWPASTTIDGTLKEVCDEDGEPYGNCIDLSELVPDYLPAIPKDPQATTGTDYYIALNSNNTLALRSLNSDSDSDKYGLTPIEIATTSPEEQTYPEGSILISTCQGLEDITNNLSADYYLVDNIDCSSFGNFSPIGSQTAPFTGTFDGQNYNITDINISEGTNEYTGLFSTIDSASEVKNFTISGSVSGGTRTGSVAGQNNGTVSNVISYVYILANGGHSGGLIGQNSGTILDSGVEADIETISMQWWIGGLSGTNYGVIRRCYKKGDVLTDNTTEGGSGLVGYMNDATVEESYTTEGEIWGFRYNAGLIGFADGTSNVIRNNYSDMDLYSLWKQNGGLLGAVEGGTIENNYYAGAMTTGGGGGQGIFIGNGYVFPGGTYTENYYLKDSVNNTNSCLGDIYQCWAAYDLAGVHQKSDAELKQELTFVGWDFTNIWYIDEDNDYPKLQWQN